MVSGGLFSYCRRGFFTILIEPSETFCDRKPDKRGVALVEWDSVCRQKEQVGLNQSSGCSDLAVRKQIEQFKAKEHTSRALAIKHLVTCAWTWTCLIRYRDEVDMKFGGKSLTMQAGEECIRNDKLSVGRLYYSLRSEIGICLSAKTI